MRAQGWFLDLLQARKWARTLALCSPEMPAHQEHRESLRWPRIKSIKNVLRSPEMPTRQKHQETPCALNPVHSVYVRTLPLRVLAEEGGVAVCRVLAARLVRLSLYVDVLEDRLALCQLLQFSKGCRASFAFLHYP